MIKIAMDLQQNFGGDLLLATDTFKQFSPQIDPFGGSRLRSFAYSNALGSMFTENAIAQNTNQNPNISLIDSPWEATQYVGAELFGPLLDSSDLLSTVQTVFLARYSIKLQPMAIRPKRVMQALRFSVTTIVPPQHRRLTLRRISFY